MCFRWVMPGTLLKGAPTQMQPQFWQGRKKKREINLVGGIVSDISYEKEQKQKEKILKKQHINKKLQSYFVPQRKSRFFRLCRGWCLVGQSCFQIHFFYSANIAFTLLTATFEKRTYFSENWLLEYHVTSAQHRLLAQINWFYSIC